MFKFAALLGASLVFSSSLSYAQESSALQGLPKAHLRVEWQPEKTLSALHKHFHIACEFKEGCAALIHDVIEKSEGSAAFANAPGHMDALGLTVYYISYPKGSDLIQIDLAFKSDDVEAQPNVLYQIADKGASGEPSAFIIAAIRKNGSTPIACWHAAASLCSLSSTSPEIREGVTDLYHLILTTLAEVADEQDLAANSGKK